jgi:hypothetical protein
MKKGAFLFAFFTSMIVWGQKDIHKSLLSPEIKNIHIDITDCYRVLINTQETNELIVDAAIEGEYSPNQLVDLSYRGNTLYISPNFRKDFVLPNDKLSAHKVLSVELSLSIPENKVVSIYGTSSALEISGGYKELNVALNDGDCHLESLRGNIRVKTQKGNITLFQNTATIDAKSTYGTVSTNNIPKGETFINLESTTGNISLHKTE